MNVRDLTYIATMHCNDENIEMKMGNLGKVQTQLIATSQQVPSDQIRFPNNPFAFDHI